MKNNKFFNSLIWKIGGTFLLILIILSAIYLYISVYTAEMYFQEANQKLDKEIAPHIASDNQCFINGEVNEKVLKSVFHDVMIINPSLEVYLLDKEGNILTYFAPNKKIKLDYVSLDPINNFINIKGEKFILGDDPRNPGEKKAFSAAKVFENEEFMGYIYTILGGEEYENATQLVFGSYILKLGIRSMGITLIAAGVISIIALGFITRNMRKIVQVIRRFRDGDLNARIKMKGKGELNEFADAFNEMADTIVQNMEDLKTMDNLRRELVANVSHDLRTPLATIQGYIETIMIKADILSEDERKRYMQTILGSTERLKKLVEELFELSKLEAKETKPAPEPFPISELAQDIQQKNLLIAEEKNIKLKLNFPYELPMAYADIGMMERVLQNLLDNAIKFTPKNGTININLIGKKDRILVSVEDSGRGIKSDQIDHIFDRYKQVQRVETDKNEGLGLGLAIVKKILEVHNIEISVDSEVGKGTKFYFDVPVYKGEKVTELT